MGDDVTNLPEYVAVLRGWGYRAWQDTLSGGRWVISRWDEIFGVPCGEAIGTGPTAAAAWADAVDRVLRPDTPAEGGHHAT